MPWLEVWALHVAGSSALVLCARQNPRWREGYIRQIEEGDVGPPRLGIPGPPPNWIWTTSSRDRTRCSASLLISGDLNIIWDSSMPFDDAKSQNLPYLSVFLASTTRDVINNIAPTNLSTMLQDSQNPVRLPTCVVEIKIFELNFKPSGYNECTCPPW